MDSLWRARPLSVHPDRFQRFAGQEPVPGDDLVGQKAPLKLREIWAIRTRLQMAHNVRDLALFNLAIDSKLRGCDLVGLRVCDVSQGSRVLP